MNASTSLDEKTRAVYLSTWRDGFADVGENRLKAAFVACLRSLTFKTMPTIGDVRQHLTRAEESAASLEAERKWQEVLAYAQSTSPDYASRPVRFKEQTRAAINVAGGLDWIRDCRADELQWAKKRFKESYEQWNAMDKGQYLLPDGEVKNLLTGIAQTKALPAAKTESYQTMRARGLAYAEQLKTAPAEDANIKRALCEVRQRAYAPSSPARTLDEQKRILRERGFMQ